MQMTGKDVLEHDTNEHKKSMTQGTTLKEF